jgi:hypothetical protein
VAERQRRTFRPVPEAEHVRLSADEFRRRLDER